MPRLVRPLHRPPVSVQAAIEAFGSEARVELLRYYLANPGTQIAAARALGIAPRSVGNNVVPLVATGVLIETTGTDRRSSIYVVDRDRLRELQAALADYLTPASPEDAT